MNLPLIFLYGGTVLASLALAWLVHWAVQHRTSEHVKAHGWIGGFMEWWLYGRQSNWGEAVQIENNLPDEAIRRMWDEATPVAEGAGRAVAPRRLEHVKSVRLSNAELEHVQAAAAKRGLALGVYMRQATIQQASDDRMRETITATSGYGHVLASRVPPA